MERCAALPGVLRLLEAKRTARFPWSHCLKLGSKLLQRVAIQLHRCPWDSYNREAATANQPQNYARALKDFPTGCGNRKPVPRPKTLFTQMARCYDAWQGSPKPGLHLYGTDARMWTDTLAQHNLTQQMAEFNVKYHTRKGIGDSPPATRTTGTPSLPAKSLHCC
ncbi:MAG: hypothetical protein ACLUVY_06430 [Bacteroides uniformis]